jgi:RNA polymerase sigma-70 factor (ECF subfamily)
VIERVKTRFLNSQREPGFRVHKSETFAALFLSHYNEETEAAIAASQGERVEIDDRTLARRAQRGDTRAFATLVTRHLTQEAFLRAWRGIAGFRGADRAGGAKFTTWLYRIVTNLCYNRLPGLRRQLAQVGAEALDDVSASDASTIGVASDPHALVEAGERRARVQAAIEALPRKYKLVVTLYYLQEQSYQEIAATLGLPLGTVKTHLYRARERLKRQLVEGQR